MLQLNVYLAMISDQRMQRFLLQLQRAVAHLFFSGIIFAQSLTGQDLHATFSQFMPLYVNPAKTGKFFGSYRMGGMYRDQFGSFIEKAYRSPMGWVDVPFEWALAKSHWTALGILYYKDWAGDIALSNTGIITSGAYHIGLNKKAAKVISVGFQFASVTRNIGSAQNAVFSQTIRTGSSPDQNLIQNFKGTYRDLNAGMMYTARTDANHHYEIGFAIYHLNNPSVRYSGSQRDSEIGRRLNVHAKYYYPLHSRWGLEPSILHSSMGKASNTNVQLHAYLMPSQEAEDTKKRLRNGIISAGIGYRLQDALQFMLGYQWKNWMAGLAYDYTISTAASYNRSFGAIELGIIYIGVVEKKVKSKPKVFCPRF